MQPLVALALQLQTLGQDVRLCVPPDFREWIETLGFQVIPIRPNVRQASRTASFAPPTPEQLRQLAEASVAVTFQTIAAAAHGCDMLVGATALQIAARSVAELLGIRMSSSPTARRCCHTPPCADSLDAARIDTGSCYGR